MQRSKKTSYCQQQCLPISSYIAYTNLPLFSQQLTHSFKLFNYHGCKFHSYASYCIISVKLANFIYPSETFFFELCAWPFSVCLCRGGMGGTFARKLCKQLIYIGSSAGGDSGICVCVGGGRNGKLLVLLAHIGQANAIRLKKCPRHNIMS